MRREPAWPLGPDDAAITRHCSPEWGLVAWRFRAQYLRASRANDASDGVAAFRAECVTEPASPRSGAPRYLGKVIFIQLRSEVARPRATVQQLLDIQRKMSFNYYLHSQIKHRLGFMLPSYTILDPSAHFIQRTEYEPFLPTTTKAGL